MYNSSIILLIPMGLFKFLVLVLVCFFVVVEMLSVKKSLQKIYKTRIFCKMLSLQLHHGYRRGLQVV